MREADAGPTSDRPYVVALWPMACTCTLQLCAHGTAMYMYIFFFVFFYMPITPFALFALSPQSSHAPNQWLMSIYEKQVFIEDLYSLLWYFLK